MEHGQPRSYLNIDSGVEVFSSDGERLGVLEHVLADDSTSIFDGIVIDVKTGPGGHRFVDAPQVAEFRQFAVLLGITAAEAQNLPSPAENPTIIQHGGAEDSESALSQKLRRAWELISGRY
jgi:hypothetical protein